MADVPVTVIGAGVVGLAIAAELSERFSPLLLLERNATYGQETSSRNSEVIHAGIYYPRGSLKARLCVEGNRLLYELCARHDIPHRRLTKIITASLPAELSALEALAAQAGENGVTLQRLSAAQVHDLEPRILSAGGLLSPTTGILSAHGVMDYFHHRARENGADVQFLCSVERIERVSGEFLITVREQGGSSAIRSERVVNAAGLDADSVASAAGIDIDSAGYRLHWCKGSYFALPPSLSGCISRLVYPVPTTDSLGVHALLDLGGRLRFGPDVEYLADRNADYRVEESKRARFAESVRKILPFVRDEDLSPDLSGIRPKLQAPGGPARDFVIREESDRGLPGFVNLIGIDSPGLTSSPAIARFVSQLPCFQTL